MRRSRNTLVGRVHEQARLEVRHDVAALYALIDPRIRARLEGRRDDRHEEVLAELRASCATVRSAEVEEVEILEARKSCERHGGRPAALVRSVVRYDERPTAHETREVWVRDGGVWYTTVSGGASRRQPAPDRA